MADFITPILGAALGGIFGGSDSKTTQNRDPWAPAQPWLLNNIASGQKLQNYYQQNPFSEAQKQAYSRQFDANDLVRQTIPGLTSQLSSSQMFNRSNPTQGPSSLNFGLPSAVAANAPASMVPGGSGTATPSSTSSTLFGSNPFSSGAGTGAGGGAYTVERPPSGSNSPLGGNDGVQGPGFDSLNNTSALTSTIAGLLGNFGFTGLSDAIAKSNGANYSNEGRNSVAPTSDAVEGDYSNEGRNSVAPTVDASSVDTDGADSDGADSDGADGKGDGVDGYSKGGMVSKKRLHGADPKGPDEGYAALKSGEYVVNKGAVKKYGSALLADINSKRFQKRG